MSLQIGIARTQITPPLGISMIGFAGRDPASGVHDPLQATALSVAEGDDRALIVSLDLLQLTAPTVADFRQSIAATTSMDPQHIILACTHNHYGPAIEEEETPLVHAYREQLGQQLAQIGQQALDQLQPARIGVAWGSSDIAINRRELRDGRIVLGDNPEGPVDHAVGVARIEDSQGQPLATLMNYACHPVSQGGQMAHLSADFPGRATQVVEELTGAPCLYLQGACGDVNPIRMENSYEPARSLGVRLGCEAARVWETIQTEQEKGLGVSSRTIQLPAYRHGSPEQVTQLVSELEQDIETRTLEGDTDSGAMWWARLRLARAQRARHSWQSGEPLDAIEAEVTALRIGPLALATAPGEIFSESGQHVKAHSPHPHTFFVGYTNGSVGYVPTRDAYVAGGYEVTHACQLDPDAGEIISDSCDDLLSSIAAGQ